MEMTYDGALVMPSSYAVMDEDEMTYTQGGGVQTLKNNLWGLACIVRDYLIRVCSNATVGRVLAMNGLTWSQIARIAGSYSVLATKVIAAVGSVTRWLGAHAFVIGVAAGAAGFALMWNCRIFY